MFAKPCRVEPGEDQGYCTGKNVVAESEPDLIAMLVKKDEAAT